MHVTKYKTRYLVRLTPSEFEVLSHMHTLAGADIENDPDGAISVLSPAAKRAVRHGRIGNRSAFDVDTDRSN